MFDHDVFISYPHLSNKDDASEQNGWVARFHNDLENKLNQAVGHETSIWRDSRMPIGTQFGKAISNRLGKAKVLVCLISPAYLQSEWCRRELEQFRKSAAQNGGLTVGEQSRVIVVIQIPAAVNELGLGEGLYSKFYDVIEYRRSALLVYTQHNVPGDQRAANISQDVITFRLPDELH